MRGAALAPRRQACSLIDFEWGENAAGNFEELVAKKKTGSGQLLLFYSRRTIISTTRFAECVA